MRSESVKHKLPNKTCELKTCRIRKAVDKLGIIVVVSKPRRPFSLTCAIELVTNYDRDDKIRSTKSLVVFTCQIAFFLMLLNTDKNTFILQIRTL